MTLSRNTFYWLWFLLFGVISSVVTWLHTHHLGTEDFWLLGVGLAGLLIGSKALAAVWSKPFDLVVGITFFTVGLLGILHTFGVDLINRAGVVPGPLLTECKFLGFSLALWPAVVHTALGYLTLRFALKSASSNSSLEVSTSPK